MECPKYRRLQYTFEIIKIGEGCKSNGKWEESVILKKLHKICEKTEYGVESRTCLEGSVWSEVDYSLCINVLPTSNYSIYIMNITVVTEEKLNDNQIVELLELYSIFFEVPINQIFMKEREVIRVLEQLFSINIYSKSESELSIVKSKGNSFKFIEFISGASPNLEIISDIYIDYFDTPKKAEEGGENNNSNKNIIIGASVGLVVVIIIVGIVVWRLKKFTNSSAVKRRSNIKRTGGAGGARSVRMASGRGGAGYDKYINILRAAQSQRL